MSEANGPALDTLTLHAGPPPSGPAGRADWRLVLEERLAALEGGSAAVAVNSGQAARLLALWPLCRPGDEIIVPRRLASVTAAELAKAFAPFGWRFTPVESDDADAYAAAVSPRTKAILVESLGDTGGAVTDLTEVAGVARRASVPLIVDNTLATPALCRPFEFGADVVIHSTAEFIAGEPAAPGGAIVDGGVFDWTREGRYPPLSEPQPELDGEAYCRRYGNYAFAMACKAGERAFGFAMPAEAARLAVAGVETLRLRVRRQSETALAVAERLATRRDLGWVNYAGLPGHRQHNLARRYFGDCAGAIMTAALREAAGAERVVNATRLLSAGAAIGGRRSSICRFAANGRNAGEDAATVRLSIGLESADDLIADIEQAFAAAA